MDDSANLMLELAVSHLYTVGPTCHLDKFVTKPNQSGSLNIHDTPIIPRHVPQQRIFGHRYLFEAPNVCDFDAWHAEVFVNYFFLHQLKWHIHPLKSKLLRGRRRGAVRRGGGLLVLENIYIYFQVKDNINHRFALDMLFEKSCVSFFLVSILPHKYFFLRNI